MNLRPYQHECVESTLRVFESGVRSALWVMPTGTGKTVTFAELIRRFPGRALVVAHREELVHQAADKIQKVTGLGVEIEMADRHAGLNIFRQSKVVCASKDTLVARNGRRLRRMKPDDFSLVIADEAHHAVAPTYRRILDYFRPAKVLGVTATPDRTDRAALGKVFECVAYTYEILSAIDDGWLVDIAQKMVMVQGLDYTSCRTTAGDLNQADVARVQGSEEILHRICEPIVRLAQWRQTIVFSTPGYQKGEAGEDSFHIAERMTEILNRYKPGSAMRVSQHTPRDERRSIIRAFSERRFQFLVNVGVFTEGYDEPRIEMVAIARPTKSRALYAQMIGRGTRPLPGLVDGLPTANERCAAIRSSEKPQLEVLDLVGVSGRHKLVTAADVLGGNWNDTARARVKKMAEEGKESAGTLREQLDNAEREIAEEQQEIARRAREGIKATTQIKVKAISPFNVFSIEPPRESKWNKGRAPTMKQRTLLAGCGISVDGMSFTEASRMVEEVVRRRDQNLCTFRQARLLKRWGMDPNVSFTEASRIIDGKLNRKAWRAV